MISPTGPAADDVQPYELVPGPPYKGISISPNRWLGRKLRKADIVNGELKMCQK